MDLTAIPAFTADDFVHVVVESPRGSNLKLKYEPRWEAMSISRPLPIGVTFPFDWGFVPGTLAADGDPLDALVLWDVPSYPGVVLACRAIGVLMVEQNKRNHDPSERVRNDRILVVPVEARREAAVTSLDDFPSRVRDELASFTSAATALEGKDVRIAGWGDPAEAMRLIAEAVVGGERPNRV
jgi:inorganic pyrophosphatase